MEEDTVTGALLRGAEDDTNAVADAVADALVDALVDEPGILDVTAPLDNALEDVAVGIAGLLLAGGMTAVDEVRVTLGMEMGIDKEGTPVELPDRDEIVAELDPVALALVLVLLGPMGRIELNNEGKRPAEVLLLLLADADKDAEDAEEVAVGTAADE